ncbi:Pre-mRNA-splicing factor SYF1 [Cichlidogyrus casuarinus]|uniref:Pre-mRNA-splicing factor SYF1 n=1 Tax=Cichlidogyrus casuarinus TaxID=1844966 RepID=A0ABD2QIT9_9PLAT
MGDLTFDENDLPYEENLIQNAYNVKAWLRYIEFKKDSPPNVIYMLYERAIKQLPGSYKIWYRYLKLRRIHARRLCVGSLIYEETNNAHERALVTMHKMPRIWHDYLQFLMYQGFITRTRRTMDRALRSLPVTQHQRIWRLYLRFVDKHGPSINESCLRVYRRYVKFAPDDMERFVNFLTKNENYNEAVSVLASIINDEHYGSREGKSKFQLWQDLCNILVKKPDIASLKADPVGVLWNSLAEFYIRSENLVRARDIYIEGMNTVMTVKDFTQIFDAFAEFEESIAQTQMQAIESTEDVSPEVALELDLCMARIETLMEKRPLMVNSVLLRQNPHNVAEWLNRIEEKQLKEAMMVLEKATGVTYVHVNDLAAIYCEWAEMELRNNRPEAALRLLAKATTGPGRKIDYYDRSESVQARVHKSLKLWSLYTDLEESFGTFQTTKAAYDQVIHLHIATPQMIMNYALFLEEHNYFEESFTAYEKGIALFKWPFVYDIWTCYLTKFIKRYGGTKLERARDLFEQCLEHCPAKFAKSKSQPFLPI